MALKPCKECGKEISDNAKACPHCGVEYPEVQGRAVLKGCLSIVGLLFFVGLCTYIVTPDDPAPADPPAAPAPAEGDIGPYGVRLPAGAAPHATVRDAFDVPGTSFDALTTWLRAIDLPGWTACTPAAYSSGRTFEQREWENAARNRLLVIAVVRDEPNNGISFGVDEGSGC